MITFLWFTSVAFAFLAFIIWIQVESAMASKKTWFFKNKTLLGLIATVIAVASISYLYYLIG